MARPKGSKNKTRIVNANVDYAAVVAEKTAEKEKIESEVATLTANLDDLKTQLKAKKAELKAATKELTKAEKRKKIRNRNNSIQIFFLIHFTLHVRSPHFPFF